MNHFIQQSHKGRPLLLVALLVASAGAARAQGGATPDAGTVGVRINHIDPTGAIQPNATVVTMYVTTSAYAGAVDAAVTTTNEYIQDGTTYSTNVGYFELLKRTGSRGESSGLSAKVPLPGHYTAGSTAKITAPGTTTVVAINTVGFTAA